MIPFVGSSFISLLRTRCQENYHPLYTDCGYSKIKAGKLRLQEDYLVWRIRIKKVICKFLVLYMSPVAALNLPWEFGTRTFQLFFFIREVSSPSFWIKFLIAAFSILTRNYFPCALHPASSVLKLLHMGSTIFTIWSCSLLTFAFCLLVFRVFKFLKLFDLAFSVQSLTSLIFFPSSLCMQIFSLLKKCPSVKLDSLSCFFTWS